MWGRLVSLTLIGLLATVLTPWPGPIYLYGLLVLFIFLGYLSYLAARAPWRRAWHSYAFVTADFALLSFTLIYPNPLIPFDLPPQMGLRFGNFIYFFVLLSGLTYLYKPGLVLWGGFSAAVSWFVGIMWLQSLPGSVWREPEDRNPEEFLALFGNAEFIDLGIRLQEVMVLLITAGLLALAVQRARAIALRQANLAGERTNLARYFPRKTVDMLAAKKATFSRPREHDAAVLFADLVSFTSWAETRSPRRTIAILREVHNLMAEVIFKHEGTLDKFIGDGMMATFGTPEPSKRDAINALSAAVDMVHAFESWRRSSDDDDIRELKLAIGVHYGPIVLGDIGNSSRMEFAVLGDTVNVAARLEKANREIGSRCIVSADLVDAAKFENPDESTPVIANLQNHDPLTLRGRSRTTQILVLQ